LRLDTVLLDIGVVPAVNGSRHPTIGRGSQMNSGEGEMTRDVQALAALLIEVLGESTWLDLTPPESAADLAARFA